MMFSKKEGRLNEPAKLIQRLRYFGGNLNALLTSITRDEEKQAYYLGLILADLKDPENASYLEEWDRLIDGYFAALRLIREKNAAIELNNSKNAQNRRGLITEVTRLQTRREAGTGKFIKKAPQPVVEEEEQIEEDEIANRLKELLSPPDPSTAGVSNGQR